MNTFKKLLILLSFAPIGLQAQNNHYTIDEIDVVSKVDIMDSLLADFQYKMRFPTKRDTAQMNRYYYKPDEVPTFTPEIYEQRLKELCFVVPMDYNPAVQAFIDVYAFRRRLLSSKLLGLQLAYFPMVEEIFIREGVPVELKYLAHIESALNPHAVSPAGATGLWQFMYGTGKMYGLKIDSNVDERKDPEKATIAAARYLKDLYGIYNDWLLVIAAYNCGPGYMNRALHQAGGTNNYWKVRPFLPRETASYVPAFIGCIYTMEYATEHNLYPVYPDFTMYEDKFEIVNEDVTLEQIAALSGVSITKIKLLNPELKTDRIPRSSKPYHVRLPNKGVFELQMRKNRHGNLASAFIAHFKEVVRTESDSIAFAPLNPNLKLMYHTVIRGQSLRTISAKYDVSEKALSQWNGLTNTYLNPGQMLKVYVPKAYHEEIVNSKPAKAKNTTAAKPAAPLAMPSTNYNAYTQPNNGNIYKVQSGDTLWDISQKTGVGIDKLYALNGLHKYSTLQIGQVLRLN